MTQFNLNEVIQDVLMLLISELRRHDVTLETALATDLQPVTGERIQLQQVILNLIVNVIEAMIGTMQQPKMLQVSSQRAEAGGALITVTDTGTGIDPEDIDRIFDAFFTTKVDGMRMRLYRRILRWPAAGVSQSAKRLRVSVHRAVG
jgi:C4-dicarboxylate-specific signal transduction histidine kinase